jgi:hypothetical protein
MSLLCPRPNFPFNHTHKWYERCTECGRIAWDHEQSDPFGDIVKTLRWVHEGQKGQPPAPIMKEKKDA